MIDPTDTPDKATDDALFMADERATICCLLAGTGAMRAAGEKYLPKHPAESADAYKYRVAVSTLYNGMRRTIETLAGKPFSEPIKLGQDVPPQIVEWCDDVDLQGRDLHAFAHAVFTTALADGISHVLVEYPPTVPNATLADKKATGARPYFVHIKHDQILGWRSQRIAGVETLTMLRFMETVTEAAGTWKTKCIKQIRVLEQKTWQILRENEKGEWIVFDEGVVTLGAVPLATVYCDRQGYMMARPPLLDLAYLNIEHWQSSSDQSNILHVARVPILFGAGFEDGAVLSLGAGSAVLASDPTAKLAYVEHTGAAIDAGRESIKDIEERMSLMGAQLLVKKPGARTATEKAIDSADADSALSLMVRNLEDSLEYALQFMADWEGIGPAGEVELVGEIGGLEDIELTWLLRARELGSLSAETVFAELQRRGLLSDDIEWAEERARIKAEGPTIAIGGSFEAPNTGATGSAAPATTPAANAPTDTPGADFGPLIEALHAHTQAMAMPEPSEPVDFTGLIDAIKGQAAPQITVNVPEHPAPTINIAPPAVTVEAAQITINPPAITVEAAQITLPQITVESPTINVQPPQIVQPKASSIEFQTNAAGDITGASLS